MTYRIHIGTVVVSGGHVESGEAIAERLRQNISDAISAGSLQVSADSSWNRLDGGAFVSPDGSAASMTTGIAASISNTLRGLTQPVQALLP